MTEQQSQQRINEAAEQFTDALVESYKVVAERGAAAQEQNAQLTETFFNRVVENLRSQAEQNRQATQHLADQQQRQADAAQTLTQESVDAYMNFLNSAFSFWQRGVQTADRGVRETSGPPRARPRAQKTNPSIEGRGYRRVPGLIYWANARRRLLSPISTKLPRENCLVNS